MKGYNKKGCYRFGGTLKTKEVHGVRTGNHSNPNVVDAARRYDCAPERRNGGPLTTERRNDLPTKDFALPKDRAYPINDPNHARNALSRVAQHGTPEQKAKVRSAVHRKYPNIGKD